MAEFYRKLWRNKRILTAVFFLIVGLVMSSSISGFAQSKKSEEKFNKYYTSISIKKGDTLWSIASEYMTAEYDNIEEYILEVKRINHISGDTIYAGRYLTVPYYSMENNDKNLKTKITKK